MSISIVFYAPYFVSSMTKHATIDALQQAQMSINDVQVVELHDCFSANELITYEALGLCGEGKAGEFIDSGNNTYGGKYVVNPSGGLISKGHPLGATGLAQCAELVWQLRGQADKRQVKGVTGALQHNLGLGGAVVVAIYKRPQFSSSSMAISSNSLSRAQTLSTLSANPTSSPTPSEELKAASVFTELAKRVNETLVKKINATYRFDISGTTSWIVDLKNGSGKVEICSKDEKADCIIIMKDQDFVDLMSGVITGQQAFMKGKLKAKGNMMLAQKLALLRQQKSKL